MNEENCVIADSDMRAIIEIMLRTGYDPTDYDQYDEYTWMEHFLPIMSDTFFNQLIRADKNYLDPSTWPILNSHYYHDGVFVDFSNMYRGLYTFV